MSGQVFEPEVIADNPFPGEVVQPTGTEETSTGGIHTPTTTKPTMFPSKKIAVELIGEALNTRSRKILAEFEFTPSGALQIGKFENGVSGDLRISPNGITARDLAGLTTFALDGTTGDAVFKGTVRAGSFISGKGNGSTVGPVAGVNGADFDDVQEAIDYINASGGGVVLIKVGTYVLTSDITLYSNVILEGEDMDMTILDFNGGAFQLKGIGTSGTHKRNIEVRDLQIKNSTFYDYGVFQLDYADDCAVTRCKFDNIHLEADPAGGCIYADHTNRLEVTENQFLNSDAGVRVANSNQSHVEFNYFYNILGTAYSIYVSNETIFRHNTENTCGNVNGDAVNYITGACANAVFDSNFFLLCRTSGIWNEGSTSISITNNVWTVTGAPWDALSLHSVNRCIITGNRIIGFSSDGIYLADSDFNVITGNVITGCGGYGVFIDGATNDKNVVVGNALISNTDGAVGNTGTASVVANNSS